MAARKVRCKWLPTIVLAIGLGQSAYGAGASPLYPRGYTTLPEPQQVELKGADFEFGNGWRLSVGAGVKADDVAVESLKAGLSERFGITLENTDRSRNQVIDLAIQPGSVEIGQSTDTSKAAIEEQAFKLELNNSAIRITANAPAGLFYGVETLVQMVKPAEGKLWLPTAQITDWPDLEMRIIYWDDNHHLDHMDVLKAALRQAAFYKANGFAIKLNGHFEYQSAPALVEPYALSPEQLQELTDYGLKYHIQLIPYLDGPAHIAFILKHPEYASLRAFPDSNYELCTMNPNSYKLLDGMYQNLLDANKGVKYFVLSTDEPYYVGLSDNAQCHEAKLAKQLGSAGRVETAFVTKTAGYLHDHGRTVLFWPSHPIRMGDIPSLPSYVVTGTIYSPEFATQLKARGIPQIIYAHTEGVEPYFPSYYLLPPSKLFNPVRMQPEIDQLHQGIAFNATRDSNHTIGEFIAAWGDEGLHPETFWLGFATGASWGWNPAAPNPDEAMSNFYHLFYGQGAVNMGRLYQLMSTQAEFWDSSWDSEPSSDRKPIFGNSNGVFKVRQPEHDQTLMLPPVPQGEYLRLPFDWSLENARRIQMAQDNLPANDELFDLLHTNLRTVQFQRYNLEVFLSIAGLYRQNLQMLGEMQEIDGALKAAQAAAAQVQYQRAVASLDRALGISEETRTQRNAVLQAAVNTWYKSWDPRVEEANGRHFLNAIDDVKDHLPLRTVDMSYLVYRELLLPLGQWFDQVQTVRNQYAQAHGLPLSTKTFDWKDTHTIVEMGPIRRH